jgi:hypothetical protein
MNEKNIGKCLMIDTSFGDEQFYFIWVHKWWVSIPDSKNCPTLIPIVN